MSELLRPWRLVTSPGRKRTARDCDRQTERSTPRKGISRPQLTCLARSWPAFVSNPAAAPPPDGWPRTVGHRARQRYTSPLHICGVSTPNMRKTPSKRKRRKGMEHRDTLHFGSFLLGFIALSCCWRLRGDVIGGWYSCEKNVELTVKNKIVPKGTLSSE